MHYRWECPHQRTRWLANDNTCEYCKCYVCEIALHVCGVNSHKFAAPTTVLKWEQMRLVKQPFTSFAENTHTLLTMDIPIVALVTPQIELSTGISSGVLLQYMQHPTPSSVWHYIKGAVALANNHKMFLDRIAHRDNRILSFIGHGSYMSLQQMQVNLFATLQFKPSGSGLMFTVTLHLRETAWRALPHFVHTKLVAVPDPLFEPVAPPSPRVFFEHQYLAFRDMLRIEQTSLNTRFWYSLQDNQQVFVQRHALSVDAHGSSVFVHRPGFVKPDDMLFGGLLCNDRGTGKTFVAAALIRSHPAPADFAATSDLNLQSVPVDDDETSEEEIDAVELPEAVPDKTAVRTTLVIVPAANLLAQWIEELEMLNLRVALHHGRHRVTTISDLQNYDVVVTTADTLRLAVLSSTVSVFHEAHFWRIVCDEGHRLLQGNRLSRAGLAVRTVSARNRWVLTATPDMSGSRLRQFAMLITGSLSNVDIARNSLLHYYVRFPGRFIENTHVPVMEGLTIRYDAVTNVLPEVIRQTHEVALEPQMAAHYTQAVHRIRAARQGGMYMMRVFNNLLTTLNGVGPMRWPDIDEAANPIGLEELPQDVYDCSICLDVLRGPMRSACSHFFCQDCIVRWLQNSSHCPLCRGRPYPLVRFAEPITGAPPGAGDDGEMPPSSAKMAFLIGHIENLLNGPWEGGEPPRILVFSRYLPVRRLLLQTLGEAATADIGVFQAGQARVLIMSFLSGSVGLNLMQANHVILCEPCFRKSTEEQAIGRAARLGQRRTVHVHYVLMQNTVEASMARLPRENRMSIQDAL